MDAKLGCAGPPASLTVPAWGMAVVTNVPLYVMVCVVPLVPVLHTLPLPLLLLAVLDTWGRWGSMASTVLVSGMLMEATMFAEKNKNNTISNKSPCV